MKRTKLHLLLAVGLLVASSPAASLACGPSLQRGRALSARVARPAATSTAAPSVTCQLIAAASPASPPGDSPSATTTVLGGFKGYGNWGGYPASSCVATDPVAATAEPTPTEPSPELTATPPDATPEVLTAAAQPTIDLELLEVRQLDRGTADEGPAYRVTLRNKSGEAVNQAFHVVLAATIGRQPSREGAFATAEVNAMEAGRPVSVDLRLPAKALSLGENADGQPVPFSWLTALVDSHQELPQVTRENDYATLNRAEIAMVAQR